MGHARTMLRSMAAALLAIAPLAACTPIRAGAGAADAGAATVAIRDVTVVDPLTGNVLPGQDVLLRGDRILAVSPHGDGAGDARMVLTGRGKYLVPALWDMHVHLADPDYLGLLLAHGVVGVRDMGGGLTAAADGCESLRPQTLQAWREEIRAGRRPGPEILISGPAVSGSEWPSSLRARTAPEARAAVAALRSRGVDGIKVYERIPLPAYLALASEARGAGLTFAGHVPEDVDLLTAIDAGQRSIEHVRDPLLVCFTDDPRRLEAFFDEDGWGDADRAWGRRANAACPAIFAALRDRPTWVTPTLTVEKSKVAVEDARFVHDPRRGALPVSVQTGFQQYVASKAARSGQEADSERLWWRTQQQVVRRLDAHGAKLLAGTDAACEGGLPGDSLHGELVELVAAGVPPLHALRAATVQPARYLGRTDEGGIAAGMRANLLLLDANPLDAIENVRRIDTLIHDGRVLDRNRLEALRGAGSPRRVPAP